VKLITTLARINLATLSLIYTSWLSIEYCASPNLGHPSHAATQPRSYDIADNSPHALADAVQCLYRFCVSLLQRQRLVIGTHFAIYETLHLKPPSVQLMACVTQQYDIGRCIICHSRDVRSSSSPSLRLLSIGSSRSSMPGPIDLEVRPLGKI